MELVWAGTLWALWSYWLLCQHLAAPALVTRASAGLLVAELVLLAVRSFGCADGGCGLAARLAGSAASVDVPALTALLVGVTALHGWQRARRSAARRLPPTGDPGRGASGR